MVADDGALSGVRAGEIGADKPDVEALMAQIREQVRRELQARGHEHPRRAPIVEIERNPETALIDYDELNYLNAHFHDWAQMSDISSHRPILGRLIVWLKRKLIFTVVDYVLKGYFDRERQFHMNLVRYLNANARYIDNRDYKNFWQLVEKIDRDIIALNERTDRLFGEAYTSVIALREELSRMREERRAA